MIFAKLMRTNTANEDVLVEWRPFDNSDDVKLWKAEVKEQDTKWNYHTSGANSMRFSDIVQYDAASLSQLPLKDVMEMPFGLFLHAQKLVKSTQSASLAG
jgi:hypothetical protein